MQRIIENFPEFKKGERNTTKHFTVLEELRKIVDTKNLYDVSEVEQDVVSGIENKNKHFKAVETILARNDIHKLEALRLVLLFALRYEGDEKVAQLRGVLKSQLNIPDE
jgi:vacuolar protein sorting-associated protein 45